MDEARCARRDLRLDADQGQQRSLPGAISKGTRAVTCHTPKSPAGTARDKAESHGGDVVPASGLHRDRPEYAEPGCAASIQDRAAEERGAGGEILAFPSSSPEPAAVRREAGSDCAATNADRIADGGQARIGIGSDRRPLGCSRMNVISHYCEHAAWAYDHRGFSKSQGRFRIKCLE